MELRRAQSNASSPDEREIAGYKNSQRLAYDCVTTVEKMLEPGMSEKEAAELLRQDLRKRGVHDWFHTPMAWFGDRSRFDGMRGYRAYLPSSRKLQREDVVILDISPVVEGYASDIGYTTSLVPKPELDQARRVLLEIRASLPALFAGPSTLGEIWRQVDTKVTSAGFDNCYRLYPFAVLGHRVGHVSPNRKSRVLIPFSYFSWFGTTATWLFLKRGILPALIKSGSRQKKEGLWAIEPHIGGKGFGAKFEELLLVEGDHARWIDDDLPHVRRASL